MESPLLILRSEEKAIPYIFLSLLNVILTMALNIMFVVYWEQGIEGVLEQIIASAFIFLVSLPIVIKRVVFDFFEKDIFLR